MKVIVFGLRGLPNVEGGIESHAENLYPAIVELGENIEIVARTSFVAKSLSKNWNGIKITRLWAPRSRIAENIIHSLLAVFYCALQRPDIVHVHAIGPGLVVPIARILRLKVVLTHHGFDYEREKWGKFAKIALKAGEWCGVKFANRVIVISKSIQVSILRRFRTSSDLIPNGVVIPDILNTNETLEDFGLTSRKYILLVSRLVPEKRHLDLVNATRKSSLTDWKVVLVGGVDETSDYVTELLRYCDQDPNVVFTGFQTGRKLQELFSHAGAFVLPSSHEGLPIALLEALSFGLPVFASDIQPNKDVGLSDHHYFEVGNTDALSEKLDSLLTLDRSDQVSMHLQDWVRSRFDWKEIAVATQKTYQSALDRK